MTVGCIVVHVTWPLTGSPTVRTNAKADALPELITDFLRDAHLGQGGDDSDPAQTNVYDVRFALCLGHQPRWETAEEIVGFAGDEWVAWSDCGSKAVECGILARVLKALDSGRGVAVLGLDESSYTVPPNESRVPS